MKIWRDYLPRYWGKRWMRVMFKVSRLSFPIELGNLFEEEGYGKECYPPSRDHHNLVEYFVCISNKDFVAKENAHRLFTLHRRRTKAKCLHGIERRLHVHVHEAIVTFMTQTLLNLIRASIVYESMQFH